MKHRHGWVIGVSVVVALVVLVLIAPGEEGAIAEGGIIYVDADAGGANTGLSWTDALVDLQDALDMADLGYQVRVAAGTYKPTHEFTAGDPRSASFQMMNGVEIYGGFEPTAGATEWEDRDWVLYETILSGDIGIEGTSADNSYHVLYNPGGTGLDSSAVLDGFTVTGGNADNLDLYPHFYGAGMYNYASSPTLSNCIFENNSSAYVGGGIAIGWYSAPTLTNCTFRGNSANSEGGGIYNWDYSSPALSNCTFEANSANDGGGMYNAYWASPTLTNCVFEGNSATYRGGGIYNWYDSVPTLINCTFWGNTASQEGGGIYNNSSTPTVTNSILWGDSPQEIANSDLFLSPLVTYSDVQGGHPGGGNIDANPSFVDAASGDFHLGPGSPCIDTGNNGTPGLPEYDFEGDERILDGNNDGSAIVDMGVDEVYYEAPPPPDVIFVDAGAEGTNTGLSWDDAFTTLQPALAWALDGVEIWVAAGTYKPTWLFSPGDSRSATFQMKNGVAIYGGFVGGETELEQRDWATNVTILSGDLSGDDIPPFTNNSENSYHVFYHPEGTNLDSTAVLDGFRVTGGNANGWEFPYYYGGGMFNIGSSPTLANINFSNNSTITGDGGGMYNRAGSSPTLTNCAFQGNGALLGGGMANYDSSPTLTNCTFVGNWAQYGGGISNHYGSPVLTNGILWGNSPDQLSGEGVIITYSDVQAGYEGEGNIDADPLLVNVTNGDYHLGPGSPCIDAGNNSAPNLPEYDFEGDPRIMDGNDDGSAIVDMGVDEAYYEAPPPPDVIFVDAAAEGANTGLSWDDAFTTLQPALAWALDGVEIWVAAGTYKPTHEFIEGDSRSASFQMKNGVAIYGGFAGGESSLDERDWVANLTILSGDIGIEGDSSDNSYHVFFHPAGTDVDGTAILDGFTITGGKANGTGGINFYGGGMFNYGSSPTLSNCTLTGNSAGHGGGMANWISSPTLTNCNLEGNSTSGEGGGMANYDYSSPMLADCTFADNSAGAGGGISNSNDSSPTLADCTFANNSAAYGGGGIFNSSSYPELSSCAFSGNSASMGGAMFNYDSAPALSNCTFEDNSASQRGGGLYNQNSSPTLASCTFSGNTADFGGGLYNDYYSSPTLTACIFSSNSALDSGGGMWNSNGSSPVLTGCAFSNNSADYGGGMNNNASSPVLTNCIFAGNSANAGNGGGMYNWDSSSPTLTNCTFFGNSAGSDGGAVFNHFNSSAALTNSILWGNSPNQIANDSSAPVITYCDVQGGYAGTGNIDVDPAFVDAGGGDFHLEAGSPCIDVGYNDAPNLPLYDFEGDERVLDGDGDGSAIVDMGVDEAYYEAPPPPDVIFVDAGAEGSNTGLSWDDAFTTLQPALAWAVDGVEIWVAAGTYKPTWEFSPGDPRSATFQMKNGVGIYGGFAGTESELGQRDWLANLTILSGDIGAEGDSSDNVYHVFYHPQGTVDGSAVLDGFAITGGNANGASPHTYGGGMLNYGSSPTLANCTFEGNTAGWDGGGIYNRDGSSPTLTNCTFNGNAANWGGGGMYNISSSSPTLTNCTFNGNASGMQGGGMFNVDSSSPVLVNCTFWGNSADSAGAMHNINGASPVLTNCTFTGNSASSAVGGIYNYQYSNPVLTNCILWGDTNTEIESAYGSAPVVTYSDVQGGYIGQGNIDVDPSLVDSINGNLHLLPNSPCIDAGNNAAPDLPEVDFEGDERILDGNGDGSAIVDMGADEVVYTGPFVVEIDIRPGSDQNVINLGSGGVLPVAILTTAEFDAATVRPGSVRFAGAAARRWTMEDVDRDGDLDLLLNFRIRELDLDEGSTQATLTGETFPHAGGVPIEGTDTVRIIP